MLNPASLHLLLLLCTPELHHPHQLPFTRCCIKALVRLPASCWFVCSSVWPCASFLCFFWLKPLSTILTLDFLWRITSWTWSPLICLPSVCPSTWGSFTSDPALWVGFHLPAPFSPDMKHSITSDTALLVLLFVTALDAKAYLETHHKNLQHRLWFIHILYCT